MSNCILSPTATRDLNNISSYFAQQNIEAGERVLALFTEKCTRLIGFPNMGKSYQFLRYSNKPPISSAQQQWEQAIDTIRHQTPIDIERQKARISEMFAQFNQDEDEADQQEALQTISSIAKTSI
jgi:plasmid stabilization system protein ParE